MEKFIGTMHAVIQKTVGHATTTLSCPQELDTTTKISTGGSPPPELKLIQSKRDIGEPPQICKAQRVSK